MKNLINIIYIIVFILLFGAWIYTGKFIFMLIEILIINIHNLLQIKKEINTKLHLSINIILFTATSLIGYKLEEYSLYPTLLFIIHTSYILYKHFKNT